MWSNKPLAPLLDNVKLGWKSQFSRFFNSRQWRTLGHQVQVALVLRENNRREAVVGLGECVRLRVQYISLGVQIIRYGLGIR